MVAVWVGVAQCQKPCVPAWRSLPPAHWVTRRLARPLRAAADLLLNSPLPGLLVWGRQTIPSPTLVRALMPYGESLVRQHDRSSLRAWLHDRRALEIPIPLPLAPRQAWGRAASDHRLLGWNRDRGLLSLVLTRDADEGLLAGGPALGMAVDVVDGAELWVHGEVGEHLPCASFRDDAGFWRDPSHLGRLGWLAGVWVHGDWALVDEDGYWSVTAARRHSQSGWQAAGSCQIESASSRHPASRSGGGEHAWSRGPGLWVGVCWSRLEPSDQLHVTRSLPTWSRRSESRCRPDHVVELVPSLRERVGEGG